MKFNLSSFSNTMTKSFSTVALKAKKYSPEILLVAGIASTLTGVVLACKATKKVDRIKEEQKEFEGRCIDAIGKECTDNTIYTEEDAKIDIRNSKIVSTMNKVKAYLAAFLCVTGGLTAVVFGHKILHDRYTGAITAFNSAMAAFNIYRQRVSDKYGEEAEQDIYFDIDKSDNAISNQDTVVKNGPASPFTFVFDENNRNWTNNNGLNAAFLIKTTEYLNQRLHSRGYLFLNEALDAFGFDTTNVNGTLFKPAHTLGWMEGIGDDCVDLGYIANDFIDRAASHEYDNMEGIAVILDFNIDGDILNDLTMSVNRHYTNLNNREEE